VSIVEFVETPTNLWIVAASMSSTTSQSEIHTLLDGG
jgi:hypothetical protein